MPSDQLFTLGMRQSLCYKYYCHRHEQESVLFIQDSFTSWKLLFRPEVQLQPSFIALDLVLLPERTQTKLTLLILEYWISLSVFNCSL
jgi:hypothetical protein